MGQMISKMTLKTKIFEIRKLLEDSGGRLFLLGLAGKAGAGKDTAAHYIMQRIDPAIPVGLADPIKEMIQTLLESLGYSLKEIDERIDGLRKHHVVDDLGVSARYLMQTLGTEWGREMVNEDIWLHAALDTVIEQLERGRPIIITDVRFDNEAEAIREAGGEIYHIVRPGISEEMGHESEYGIQPSADDTFVFNTGTLEKLELDLMETFRA